jgi:hypothetical protein
VAEEILGEDTGDEPDIEGSTILTGEKTSEDEKAAATVKAAEDAAEAKDGSGDADQEADKKSADGKSDEDKDGASVEYTDFSLPEGMTMDKEALAEFIPMAQEHKLSQADAQKFIDLQSKAVGKFVKSQTDAWADQVAKWTTVAENDAEYGKKDYDKSVMIARSAMRQIGGSKLSAALEETGMGNHPEIIRAFYRMGVAIGEDDLNFGGSNPGGQLSQAERMFPNQGKA